MTGGGTGLGRAAVRALALRGIDCMVVGRRAEPIDAVADELVGQSGDVEALSGDVTNTDDRQRIAESCIAKWGRIDILVNNAGISAWEPLLDYKESTWRSVFATNVDAAFFMAQGVLPDMRTRGWGRIVNIGSVYASLALNNTLYGKAMPAASPDDRGPVRAVAYHASKAALANVTRELAVAVARWGVTVNTVTPGMFLTEASDGLVDDDALRSITAMTPVGRFGQPHEIGSAVGFLASSQASFITGTDLVVDGGWSVW